MKDEYPGWYMRGPEQLAKLWKDALFVPDANILLHCLRHRAAVREELLKIFGGLRERLWIPYQVGLEFQRNRLVVEVAAREMYERARKDHEAALNGAKEKLRQLRAHPVIDVEAEIGRLEEAIEAFATRMREGRDAHPEAALAAATATLTELLAGRVGPRWPAERIAALKKEGAERYEKRIPPGYTDAAKNADDTAKYGDLIIWKDLIDKAKADKRPIILITDDAKEDWWRVHNGRKYGPRPELIEEFLAETGQDFHIYELEPFLRFAAVNEPAIPPKDIDVIARSVEVDNNARKRIERAAELQRVRRRRDELEIESDELIARLADLTRHGAPAEPLGRAGALAQLAAVKRELDEVANRLEELDPDNAP